MKVKFSECSMIELHVDLKANECPVWQSTFLGNCFNKNTRIEKKNLKQFCN